MPPFQQHLNQANHNIDLLTHLQATKFAETDCTKYFSDWYVTIAFYAAIHFVEGIVFSKRKFVGIGKKGLRLNFSDIKDSSEVMNYYEASSPHAVRLFLIRDNPNIFGKETYSAFSSLYEMSRTARYSCYATNQHDWIESEENLQIIKDNFLKICPTGT